MAPCRAFRMAGERKNVRSRLEEVEVARPQPGEVTVAIRYAGVNYKDALASAGHIIGSSLDCIAGSEAVGTVSESRSDDLAEGDRVLLLGQGLGTRRNGTFATTVVLPAALTLKIPAQLSDLDAATLGIAGQIAALALRALEQNGLRPGMGPVAVTGASGGSGSVAVALLAGLGHSVTGISRKSEAEEYLRGLGADTVRRPPDDRELSILEPAAEHWAGAMDITGGPLLRWLLRTARKQAPIATFGLTGGAELHTSLFPFLLRGVRLLGVCSDIDNGLRREIWEQLAGPWKPPALARVATTIVTLEDLPEILASMLRGQIQGRILVQFP